MTVHLEVADGVGTLRLERPPMNALDVATQDRLQGARRGGLAARRRARRGDLRRREGVRGGRGHQGDAGHGSRGHGAPGHGPPTDSFTAVARIPKPVVAAVTGYALGGGVRLALCADYRIAGENAKLGQPEILLGLIPGAGGTQRLARLIGPSKAKDLIFTGRQVKADEALALGLVDRVVPADEVYAQAHAWAGETGAGAGDRAAGGQGVGRHRAGDGHRHRPGGGAQLVRGPVRHGGPRAGHAQLRGGGPRQGQVPVTRVTGVTRVTSAPT
ncbi:Fatty acid oxidation complex subunit alpha [Streptomyces griseoloalbus]